MATMVDPILETTWADNLQRLERNNLNFDQIIVSVSSSFSRAKSIFNSVSPFFIISGTSLNMVKEVINLELMGNYSSK